MKKHMKILRTCATFSLKKVSCYLFWEINLKNPKSITVVLLKIVLMDALDFGQIFKQRTHDET